MAEYLYSKDIYLRAPDPEDLEIMYQIENDPSSWEVSGFTVPYSRYTLKEYIRNCRNDIFLDRQLRLMVVHKADDKVIGVVDLADFDPLHNRAAVGIIILKEFREQGIGKQALEAICFYSLKHLHIHQLYAYIPCDNLASLNLFMSIGFSNQFILKDWIRMSSGYKDAYVVQYINQDSL